MALLREELVAYSVLQYLNENMGTYGFILATNKTNPPEPEEANLRTRESFPSPEERLQELEITTLAFGFSNDDGGREAELGSTLTQYTHRLEIWTFATDPHLGYRCAHAIKHVVRHAGDSIPLRDYDTETNEVIDHLLVGKARVQHQANNSPRPWDQYVWTTVVEVTDFFVE